MEFSSEVRDGCVILHLAGRLDAFGAKEFERILAPLVAEGITCAVVDMGAVDYLSSAGLRVLAMLHRKSRERGGTVALACLRPYCRRVLEIAGFSAAFRLFESVGEAAAFCGRQARELAALARWERLETAELDCGTFRILPASEEPGAAWVLGDVKQVLRAQVREEDLRSKRFSETEYSIGLGGLGDRVEDYFRIMGEMITIGGTMVWLPTDGHDTPDFLIPKADTGEVTLRTAFNVSIAGAFNEEMLFESKEQDGTPIDTLYRSLLDLSRERRRDYKGVLGLALRAQMTAVYGSGVRRSPIAEFAPADGKLITDPSHIQEWFEFDAEPRHRGVTALICGIGVDLKADLSGHDPELLDRVFYLHPANTANRTMLLHNHGVIFTEVAMPERVASLEKEVGTVVDEGDFADMRHLLDRSTIRRAILGVSYTQSFQPDPHGR